MPWGKSSSRWTLKKYGKKIYWKACQGDETALADMRAIGDTIRKKKNRNRWLKNPANKQKNTMKKRGKLLAVTAAMIAIVGFTGCKQLTPQGAATLTTTAVYAFGRNNPKATATMREIQPKVCAAVQNPTNTVEDVVRIIQAGTDAETKEILNVLLTIYQVSIAPVGTNASDTHPYLEAVVCPGWWGGLVLLPYPTEKQAPSKYVGEKWLRVK